MEDFLPEVYAPIANLKPLFLRYTTSHYLMVLKTNKWQEKKKIVRDNLL